VRSIIKSTLVLSMLLGGVNGCVSTSDIHVAQESDPKANLSAYKTYQFIEESGVVAKSRSQAERYEDQRVAQTIELLINESLQKHGKRPTSKHPDFYVAYIGGSSDEAAKAHLNAKGKEMVAKHGNAALLILLIDAKSGEVLRVATAEAEAKHLPQEQMQQRLRFAIEKMLKGVS